MGEWRFPDNNFTNEYGLDTSDMETFKKDAYGGLAREICQNSIDANDEKKGLPTRVEFQLFEIDRRDVPGIEELAKNIEKCYEYKKDDDKENKQLLNMKRTINQDIITCLRISDFNTKGLQGVKTNENGTPFFNLTKGSGTSNKGSGSGGSKGIGKFATFVASTTNTVFYSTKTVDGEYGYIGISKLRSIPLDRPGLMTIGTGYYAVDESNFPILEHFNLDPDFYRSEDEYGTDIYVIGFNDTDKWKSNIIFKILDSFMAAILFEGFEVEVDGILINKGTVENIVNDPNMFTNRKEREVVGIKAQYDLLTSSDTNVKEFTIGEDSIIRMYVKAYTSREESKASKRCEIIRYPYMKIQEYRKQAFLPYSAVCVIEKNELNQRLREIENPEHTEWQMDRLREMPSKEATKTRKMRRELFDNIVDYINEVLKQNVGDSTDVEGASDYLPSMEEGLGEGDITVQEALSVTPVKKNSNSNPKTDKSGEEGEGNDFSTGDMEGDEDGVKIPSKGQGGNNPPNPNPPQPPNDENTGSTSGEQAILKKVPLSGIKYKNIMKKEKGSYDIIFIATSDESDCDLTIYQLGESGDKYKINILSALIDGVECVIEEGKLKKFKLQKDKKYKISYKVEEKEKMAIEVELNAYR